MFPGTAVAQRVWLIMNIRKVPGTMASTKNWSPVKNYSIVVDQCFLRQLFKLLEENKSERNVTKVVCKGPTCSDALLVNEVDQGINFNFFSPEYFQKFRETDS